jgi:hypothetical protein
MTMTQKTIFRFPRIPTAKEVGRAIRSTWQKPAFRVKETHSSTEFTHRLNFLIPEAIQEQDHSVFTMLFEVQPVDLPGEIQKAYGRIKYKGLPIDELFHRALRKVFTEALFRVFIRAKKSGDPYAKYLKGGRKRFQDAATAKRTRQEEFRIKRAIRLARLYEKLRPFAERVLGFLHDQGQTCDQQELKRELEENFLKPWIIHVTSGKALQNLPDIPGHDSQSLLHRPSCTTRQLAVGIIWSIEYESGVQPSLSPNTIIEFYIPLGRRHLSKGKFLKRC